MQHGHAPRLMIAGVSSSAGKTTMTCGLLQAFSKRGLRLSSFKCGPDYIDPMFHREVIGVASRNLDLFFSKESEARGLLMKNAGQDLSILEGVMGFYDGLGGTTTQVSSYALAAATRTPVALVVDCKGLSVSAAALVKGFISFRQDHQICCILLNRVSPSLYPGIKGVIESETGLPVLGYLPVMPQAALQSRHLGLVTASEVADLRQRLDEIAETMEKTVELDRLLALAQEAPTLPYEEAALLGSPTRSVRIAVARDQAFCFYYPENLELLEALGAELVDFSPISDAKLPESIDGLLLGGGYPELWAQQLSGNNSMREEIRTAVHSGMPCFAECGGFLYLHRRLQDEQERFWEMAGVLEGDAFKTQRLSRFGYVTLTANRDTPLCRAGESVAAHEFHYWDSTGCGDAFTAQKLVGNRSWNCTHAQGNLFAGFAHLYLPSNPGFARRFVQNCGEYHTARYGG